MWTLSETASIQFLRIHDVSLQFILGCYFGQSHCSCLLPSLLVLLLSLLVLLSLPLSLLLLWRSFLFTPSKFSVSQTDEVAAVLLPS